jgi:glycosyltransferase involved in cell wall biosynthesis
LVAYPGCDPDLNPVTNAGVIAAVKRQYGIHGDYFLHIGTLQPRKNLARLIQAFANLRPVAHRSQIQLVLAGKRGWLYDELLQQVGRLGLTGRVLFPGYVTHADKAALLSGALAYVFPSLYEGFGFPVLEAQACGTPLICAESSSLSEVVGDAALLVDPLNVDGLTQAMTRVLDDAALRADLVTRGLGNRERFSWRNCAEVVMGALEAAQKTAR